jgi:ankyrin repeat protein
MKNRLRILVILAALTLVFDGCGLFISSHHRTEDYTPVFADATAGNVAAVEAAIKIDPTVIKAKEWDGATLLHIAVGQNHKDLTEVLLNDGADVNALTTDRLTPLHMAAQNGNIEIVTLLLDKKATINPIDSKGWTPMDRANKWQHPDAAEFLKQHGGHEGTQK